MLPDNTPYSKRPYHTIYLDIDGPCSNFCLEALRAYLRVNKRLSRLDWYGTPLELTWEYVLTKWEPGVSFQKNFDLPRDGTFWEPINVDPFFWSNMPMHAHCHKLVQELATYCKDLVFCSAVHWTSDAHSGRINWLARNKLSHIEYIACKQKWRLAKSGVLLVDDHDTQVNNFVDAGGDAFLWPAIDNHLHAQRRNPIGHLFNFLDERTEQLNG